MTTEVKSKQFKTKCIGPGCATATCILVKVKNKNTGAKSSVKNEIPIKEQRRRYFVLLNKLEKAKEEGKSTGITEKQINELIGKMHKPDKNDGALTKSLKKMTDFVDKATANELETVKDEIENYNTKLTIQNNKFNNPNSTRSMKDKARVEMVNINKLKNKLVEYLKSLVKPTNVTKALDKEITKLDKFEDKQEDEKKDYEESVRPFNKSDLKEANDALLEYSKSYGTSSAEYTRLEASRNQIQDAINGTGKNAPGEGMYSDQIAEAMRRSPNFSGVISSDQIDTLTPANKMSWIMNLDSSDLPGSHWIAVYLDATGDKEINYFDPFGEPPSDDFMKQMKTLVDKIAPKTYLKMKINRIPSQKDHTDTCGYQSMNFINKRNQGLGFSEATGFKDQDNTVNGERESNKLKKQLGYGKFNLI